MLQICLSVYFCIRNIIFCDNKADGFCSVLRPTVSRHPSLCARTANGLYLT